MVVLNSLFPFFYLKKAERKISGAERALAKVEENLKPTIPLQEPETITDEERFMFRKLGLRMKAYLLLGICCSFDLFFLS